MSTTRFDVTACSGVSTPMPRYRGFPIAGCLIGAATLCLVASPAHANAGTPFMWLTMSYVVFANVLIGLFEGVVVKLVYRDCKILLVLPLFIAANYASMFVGMKLLDWIRAGLLACMVSQSLVLQAPKILLSLAAALFVITVVIESPFCWFAIRKRPRAWRKALALSLLLQTLSYIPIAAWWGRVSSYDMYLNGVVEGTTFTKNAGFTVYMLDDEALWKQNLDGSGRTRVADAPKAAAAHWLSLTAHGDKVDVVATGDALNAGERKEVGFESILAEIPLEGCAEAGVEAPFFDYNRVLSWSTDDEEKLVRFHWLYDRIGVDYRFPEMRSWSVKRFPFGLENPDVLRVDVDGSRFTVGLETPLFSLGQGPVFLLPNGEMTAKLGDTVVLVDIKSRTVGVLAQAKAYLVLPDETYAKTLLPALEKERATEEQKAKQERWGEIRSAE